jgi:hypothetical protein
MLLERAGATPIEVGRSPSERAGGLRCPSWLMYDRRINPQISYIAPPSPLCSIPNEHGLTPREGGSTEVTGRFGAQKRIDRRKPRRRPCSSPPIRKGAEVHIEAYSRSAAGSQESVRDSGPQTPARAGHSID